MLCGPVSGRIVIDIDAYKAGSASEKMVEALEEAGIKPLVSTPRGGLHFYMEYDTRVGNKPCDNLDIKSDGGYVLLPPSIVDGKPYTFLPKGNTSAVFNAKILTLVNSNYYIDTPFSDTEDTIATTKIPDGARDNTLFTFANELVKKGVKMEIIKRILGLIGNFACDEGADPVTPDMVNAKIKSALDRAGKTHTNIAADVREWVLATDGHFVTTDVHRELGLDTRRQKKTANEELRRLKDAGTIEKYGAKRGCYRMPDNDVEVININSVKVQDTGLVLPFGITQKLVYVHPKSIVLIAGSPNVGKTAFMLNVFKDNCEHFRTTYFSSEMGAMEIKSRVDMFKHWPDKANAGFRERSQNFHDVIDPDGLNLIDFLELEDNFYTVTGKLRMIQDKLNEGIAVIAIQKKKGSEEAIGGHFTMEKPKLVVTLDREEEMGMVHNVARIIKAKNWIDVRNNPVGQELRFRLRKGCEFETLSGWSGDPECEEKKDEKPPF
jgi:hypothetical protein